MAELYGSEFQKAYIDEPSGKLDANERDGRKRYSFSSSTPSADLNAGDIVKLLKIPANASIVDARLRIEAFGANNAFDIGWAAGESESADSTGLFSAVDTTAAVDVSLADSVNGYRKKFSEEVDIQIEVGATVAGASGNLIKLELEYIID